MNRFLVFIVGVVISYLVLRYRYQIKSFTGDIGFAEKYLGGTYNFLLLFGLAIFIFSLMYLLGTLQSFLAMLLGPFFVPA